MKSIEFIKDFANIKKGDVLNNIDSMLASNLVNVEKVAKYYEIPITPKKSK
jgi:hypothetical protein